MSHKHEEGIRERRCSQRFVNPYNGATTTGVKSRPSSESDRRRGCILSLLLAGFLGGLLGLTCRRWRHERLHCHTITTATLVVKPVAVKPACTRQLFATSSPFLLTCNISECDGEIVSPTFLIIPTSLTACCSLSSNECGYSFQANTSDCYVHHGVCTCMSLNSSDSGTTRRRLTEQEFLGQMQIALQTDFESNLRHNGGESEVSMTIRARLPDDEPPDKYKNYTRVPSVVREVVGITTDNEQVEIKLKLKKK